MKMITSLIRYRRYLYMLIPMAIILLAVWYFHVSRLRGETDKVIEQLRQSTATTERRSDAIIDATKYREVKARETARQNVNALPDDKLVAALEQMLAEYRAEH